jgi:sugar lactone lactonase YvrE
VAVDSRGSVYVSDGGNGRVQKLSPAGAALAQWGSFGARTGQFLGMGGLAVDAQGNVYVVDNLGARVQKLSPQGQPLAQWGTPPGPHPEASGYQFPTTVALDGSGNLYFFTTAADGFAGVRKLSPQGARVTQWTLPGPAPGQLGYASGVALDAQGNVYVAETYSHRIEKFSPQGQSLAAWDIGYDASGQPEQPIAVAVDAQGIMYVVDGGVLRLSPQGEVLAPGAGTARRPVPGRRLPARAGRLRELRHRVH